HHSAGLGPRRDSHGERRQELELVVQPIDRAVVSRERGQLVSVSALQRSTGKRFGRNQKSRRRRRDYVSRLATGRSRGIWLRRCRSARSRHHHRGQTDAIRSPDRSGAKHSSGAGANGRFSDVAYRTGCLFAARSAFALLRWKHALADARSWRSLGKYQPGFVTTELRVAGEHWKIQG